MDKAIILTSDNRRAFLPKSLNRPLDQIGVIVLEDRGLMIPIIEHRNNGSVGREKLQAIIDELIKIVLLHMPRISLSGAGAPILFALHRVIKIPTKEHRGATRQSLIHVAL